MAPELHPGVSSFSFIPGMKYAKGPVGGSTPVVFAGCLGPCDQASPPGVTGARPVGLASWYPSCPGRRQVGAGCPRSLVPTPPFAFTNLCDSPSRPKCAADSLPPGLGPPWHLLASMVRGGTRGLGGLRRSRGAGNAGPPTPPFLPRMHNLFFFFNSSPAPR